MPLILYAGRIWCVDEAAHLPVMSLACTGVMADGYAGEGGTVENTKYIAAPLASPKYIAVAEPLPSLGRCLNIAATIPSAPIGRCL